jgi:Zn-dependent peptidase ImmA (M78 family)
VPLPEIRGAAAAFLEQHPDAPPSETLFEDYARYLLHSCGAFELPVPLEAIREKYKIQRRAAALPQRGFLFGDVIFVNGDDPRAVQRFTEAHELMETLVVALRAGVLPRRSPVEQQQFEIEKERWCERGAAELLLPAELFYPLVPETGLSLQVAKQLAGRCRTSLTATLRRMLDADREACIFALLKEAHKKKQYIPSQAGQGVLWGEPSDWDPPAELRVWKRWSSPQVQSYLCLNESFTRDNLVYQVLRSGAPGEIQAGPDRLELEYIQGIRPVEAMLVSIAAAPAVMALIHL